MSLAGVEVLGKVTDQTWTHRLFLNLINLKDNVPWAKLFDWQMKGMCKLLDLMMNILRLPNQTKFTRSLNNNDTKEYTNNKQWYTGFL